MVLVGNEILYQPYQLGSKKLLVIYLNVRALSENKIVLPDIHRANSVDGPGCVLDLSLRRPSKESSVKILFTSMSSYEAS